MLSSCVCPFVCLSVRKKPVLHQNDQTDITGFWLVGFLWVTYPKQCYKEIRVTPEIRVLPSETLPQTLELENFVMTSRWCKQRNSSTVAPVDYTYDSWAHRGWMHKVYCMLADCNPPSNSVTYTCTFLIQFVPTLLCSPWQKFWLTHRIARSVYGSRASC